MHLESPLTDEDLKKAISLRFCRHFPAMKMANSLGGGKPTGAWAAIYQIAPMDMIREAQKQAIDLETIPTAMEECDCCPNWIKDTELYEACLARIKSANAGHPAKYGVWRGSRLILTANDKNDLLTKLKAYVQKIYDSDDPDTSWVYED